MVFNPLIIYDKTLTRIGVVDQFISSVWTENYCDKASCQLVVYDTNAFVNLLSPGNFVGQNGKTTLWRITSLRKEGDELWANGYPCAYTILNDRVIDELKVDGGEITTTLRDLLMDTRPADVIDLAADRELDATSDSEFSNQTLFKIVKDLCDDADYGFRFVFDRASKKLLFDIYEGEDSEAKFSELYGNLSDVELTCVDAANVARVRGDNGVFVWAGDTDADGLDRHEITVNATDVKKESGESQQDYEARLEERGIQELNEKNSPIEIDFDVRTDDYGKTFNLGDKITVIINGTKFRVRVTGIKETMESNAIKTTVTVSDPIL